MFKYNVFIHMCMFCRSLCEQSEAVIKQMTQRETIIHTAVRWKLKIYLRELHYKPVLYPGASER
jgi:hypothetical protein